MMIRILFMIIISTTVFSCAENEKVKEAKSVVEKHIRANLRDPESLKIYSQTVEKEKEHVYIVTVDYGAKNGFGGMERTNEKYKVIGDYVYLQK